MASDQEVAGSSPAGRENMTEKTFKIPPQVAETEKTLENKGFEAYLVGGCVRDLLIGKKPKDWDITTSATPEEIIASFPKTFYENDYGTVGVVNENIEDDTLKVIEVTPFRLESTYSNRRHPDSVKFSKNLEDDLKRRDFTVNAIALKIDESKGHSYKGHLLDFYKGQKDIESKIVRTVGEPDEKFSEDALRMLRGIRISCDLGFTINIETSDSIKRCAKYLKEISRERIRDEFSKILMTERPKEGMQKLHEYGLLSYFLPELEEGIGIKQNKAHAYDVWEHSLRTLQHSAKNGWLLEVRLASLFHDIGKIQARRWSEEKKDWTFHGHDVMGSRTTAKILSRLMFPVKTIEKVTKLVRWHMFFSDTEQITLSSVRRLVRNVGKEDIWDLMNVRVCDRIGTGRPKEHPYRLRKYKSMVEEVMHDPLTVGMLKINGNRIMEISEIEPGPKIGSILHILLEEIVENPKLNTVEYLENRAKILAKMTDSDLEKKGSLAKARKNSEEEKTIRKIREKYWVE